MHLALFVGRQFYPTCQEYVNEALYKETTAYGKDYTMPDQPVDISQDIGPGYGCCKKVRTGPSDVVPDETMVYLLHRENHNQPAYIFGWFTLDDIIFCQDGQQPEIWMGFMRLSRWNPGVSVICLTTPSDIPERMCGGLQDGGIYLVGPHDITYQLGLRPKYSSDDTKLHLFDDPIPTDINFFRGFMYVEDIDNLVE